MTDDDTLVSGMAPDYRYLDLARIPLHSEILPNLFLGGTHDMDTIASKVHNMNYTKRNIHKDLFDTVITLYAHARAVDWEVDELRYGFYDAGIKHIDFEKLGRVVDYAHAAWKNGDRVLIRCQAGLNRSSLTMGLLLIKEGYTPEEAIHLMRSNRSGYCLFNVEFEKYLLNLGVPNDAQATTHSIQ